MNELQRTQASTLAPSNYASYDLAKENDGIIGGSDIAQIRSYAAYARAQAQAIHKTIAATSGIEDVATIKAEATETAQTFAKVGIYADQRIGELLRELPKAKGNQYQQSANSPTGEEAQTKAKAIADAGIGHRQAYDLQTMAANPDVVEAVIAKATEEGRIVSRAQVLKAIKERDDALAEVEALERQNDQLYEKANTPHVIEREVFPADYERVKAINKRQADDYQQLYDKWMKAQRDLEKANAIIGETGRVQDVRRDVQFLASVIKQHIRSFGMHMASLDHLEDVDEPTRADFLKALADDYAMLQNVVETLIARNQMNLERM